MGLTRLTATSLRPARCCLERSRTMTVRAPCGTVVVMVTGSLGERIAAYRRRRGLSQATLAGLVGRSESWLSQVERGVRSIDRLSVLLDMARVLHVDVESLSGRPWQYAPNGGVFADGLAGVRTTLTSYDHMLGTLTPATLTLPQLRTQVFAVHRDYQGA